MPRPRRIFLDTNVYILGAADQFSPEWKILKWLGFDGDSVESIEVIISTELIEQVLRVAKRLQGKDWAGEIVSRIWHNLTLRYVLFEEEDRTRLEAQGWLPREDVGIYLTAQRGGADDFISSNHGLIRAMVAETKEFNCYTPDEFAQQYLSDSI